MTNPGVPGGAGPTSVGMFTIIITITCVRAPLVYDDLSEEKNQYSPPSPSPLQSWSSELVLVSWWIGSILTSTIPSSWPPDFLLTRITNNQLNGLRLNRTGITFEIVPTNKTRVPVTECTERPEWPECPSLRILRLREASQLSQSISCLRYFSWLDRMEQQSWSIHTAAILISPPSPPPPSL